MNPNATLADLAVSHPAAARVFYRNGLDFCCGGRRPLADVCAERGLDTSRLLADIEAETAAHPENPNWDRRSLAEIIDFIVSTYHRRLRDVLPDLRRMADKVEVRHADKASCPRGLAALLAAMHQDVLDHLEKEEQVLFPMILAGQGAAAVGPVHVMEREHDEHGRNLLRVRALTGDLQPPAEACTTWRALYLGLQQLEEELMDHIHLENNILFRRALVE